MKNIGIVWAHTPATVWLSMAAGMKSPKSLQCVGVVFLFNFERWRHSVLENSEDSYWRPSKKDANTCPWKKSADYMTKPWSLVMHFQLKRRIRVLILSFKRNTFQLMLGFGPVKKYWRNLKQHFHQCFCHFLCIHPIALCYKFNIC